jgi:hypothetical protein
MVLCTTIFYLDDTLRFVSWVRSQAYDSGNQRFAEASIVVRQRSRITAVA